jgi:hypothetical protein
MKHCDGYSLSPWCNGYGQGMRSELAVDRAPRHGPFPGRLDAQRISAYAAATGDVTAAVLTGAAVPVVFPVVNTTAQMMAAAPDRQRVRYQ